MSLRDWYLGDHLAVEDEVWSQMSGYWAATGQVDPDVVAAWNDGGRDESGFYEMGTAASLGPQAWESIPDAGNGEGGWW